MNDLFSIFKKLKGHKDFRQILANTAWLSYDKVFRLGFGLFVGALVARYLAPNLYGVFNYAVSFVSLLAILGNLGLDNILVREIVKFPDRKYVYMGTAFYLKLLGSAVIIISSFLLIYTLRPQDRLTLLLVFIISVSYVFQAFNVIDLYFQSKIKSKYTVIATNAAFIISSMARILGIYIKADVVYFAVISTVEVMLSNIGLMVFYLKQKHDVKKWAFDKKIAVRFLKDSWPLILSGAAIMIYMRIDQVMIGNMLGNRQLGIYSAAVKISEMWYFIPTAIITSVYPKIIEVKKKGEDLYFNRMQQLFNVMAVIGYAAIIFISFFCNWIINLIFGSEYLSAGNILLVHIWCGLFISMGLARSSWLLCENITKFQLMSMSVGAVLNILLNLVLIRRYGAVGSAYATLISEIVVTYVLTPFVNKRIFYLQTRSLLFCWK